MVFCVHVFHFLSSALVMFFDQKLIFFDEERRARFQLLRFAFLLLGSISPVSVRNQIS